MAMMCLPPSVDPKNARPAPGPWKKHDDEQAGTAGSPPEERHNAIPVLWRSFNLQVARQGKDLLVIISQV